MRGERSKKTIDFDGHTGGRRHRGDGQNLEQSMATNESAAPGDASLAGEPALLTTLGPDTSAEFSPDTTLEQLIFDVGRGDRNAFRALFERITPRIKGYLMRMGAGESQAEEITQDVMVAVWRRAQTYEVERAAATTWIYQIARNRRIDLWRREHRLILDPHEPMLQGEEPAEPDQILDRAEEALRVREAIALLPAELSEVLRLAYYDGLTHKEIAQKTGLPLGTAKSRIRKATKSVRNTLDPQSN